MEKYNQEPQTHQQIYAIKEYPIIMSTLQTGQLVKKLEYINSNICIQIQSSMVSMVIIQLVSQEDKPETDLLPQNTKISYEVPLNQIFDSAKILQIGFDSYLQILNTKLIQLVNSKVNQNENLYTDNKKIEAWSLRVFPFHKSKYLFTKNLPQNIAPLSLHDILSYQKTQRICNFQYIFAMEGYSQKSCLKLETQVYFNWGQSEIQFILIDQNNQIIKNTVKSFQIIIIPGNYNYTWKANSKQISKLMTWSILPKKSLQTIIYRLNDQNLELDCPYGIIQVLIDYCFHEFSLIEVKNEEFTYTLANFLNRYLTNELNFLKEIGVDESQIMSGTLEKRIDQCFECQNFIINYFGFYKNQVYCLECFKKNTKIQKIHQKMSRKVFQEGCRLITIIRSYKDQKQLSGQNLKGLMNNAVFFLFEDICDGDFVGAYNSIHCKIHQTNSKKQKNSKQKIVQNTINYIKKNLFISSPIEILKYYSTIKYKNELEKKIYRQIMVRASNFIKKQEETKILTQMLPDYKQNDLKVFAIQLCAKDKI